MGHHHLSCGARLFKGLHVFVNVLFLLAGAGLIAVGAFVLATNGASLAPQLSNLAPLAVVVIVAGGVIFFVSFLGCCGSARESRCLLTFYSIILIVFLVAGFSLGVYMFVHGPNALEGVSEQAWVNLRVSTRQQIEVDLKCCGWSTVGVPAEPSGVCSSSPWTYSQACEEVLKTWIHNSFFWIAMAAIVVASIQLFGLIVACCLSCAIRNAHREHDREKLLHEAREANRLPPAYPVYTVQQTHGYGYQQRH